MSENGCLSAGAKKVCQRRVRRRCGPGHVTCLGPEPAGSTMKPAFAPAFRDACGGPAAVRRDIRRAEDDGVVLGYVHALTRNGPQAPGLRLGGQDLGLAGPGAALSPRSAGCGARRGRPRSPRVGSGPNGPRRPGCPASLAAARRAPCVLGGAARDSSSLVSPRTPCVSGNPSGASGPAFPSGVRRPVGLGSIPVRARWRRFPAWADRDGRAVPRRTTGSGRTTLCCPSTTE